jgi:polyhydroxyalkanoate synthesis regulator phasin
MYSLKENILSKKLKPLDNQLNRNLMNEPLPKTKSVIWAIVGSKGRGKTSLLMNVLKEPIKNGGYKKHFDNIYYFSTSAKNDKKTNKLVNELDEDGKFYDEFNEANMNDVFDKIKKYNEEFKEENGEDKIPYNLIIFDDVMVDLPKSMQQSMLNRLVPNARHHNTSLFFLLQRYNGMNPLIRSQLDLISWFKTDNSREMKILMEDINIDKNRLQNLYEFSTEGPNDFLHINLLNRKFYKKFDEIIE